MLRGDEEEMFKLRGYHGKIFPLELPPWLSDDILERMVLKYRFELLMELVALQPYKPTTGNPERARTSSTLSSSALSMSSESSHHVVASKTAKSFRRILPTFD
jgi:hypothetical protein